MAIHACPSKESVCGTTKYFDFNSTYTSDRIEIVSNLDSTESCTYLLKSDCDAPSFTISYNNTVVASQVMISVTEWSEETVTFDSVNTLWPFK